MHVLARVDRVRTGLDLVQERDVPLLRSFFLSYMCDDVQVLHVRDFLIECCELVEMRREETEGPNIRCNVSEQECASVCRKKHWNRRQHTPRLPTRARNHHKSTSLEIDHQGSGASLPTCTTLTSPELVDDDQRVLRRGLQHVNAPKELNQRNDLP